MNPNGTSRCTPVDHMYDVGCLNSTSCAWTPSGRSAPPDPPPLGLSTLPADTTAIGCSGAFPPSSVESFNRTRLWKIPALVRRMVFGFKEYDTPRRGSKTL